MRIPLNTTVTVLGTTMVLYPPPEVERTRAVLPSTTLAIAVTIPMVSSITTFVPTVITTSVSTAMPTTIGSQVVGAMHLVCPVNKLDAVYCDLTRWNVLARCTSGIETATVETLVPPSVTLCQETWPTEPSILVGGWPCGKLCIDGLGQSTTTTSTTTLSSAIDATSATSAPAPTTLNKSVARKGSNVS